jgi:hypothetical protein
VKAPQGFLGKILTQVAMFQGRKFSGCHIERLALTLLLKHSGNPKIST